MCGCVKAWKGLTESGDRRWEVGRLRGRGAEELGRKYFSKLSQTLIENRFLDIFGFKRDLFLLQKSGYLLYKYLPVFKDLFGFILGNYKCVFVVS